MTASSLLLFETGRRAGLWAALGVLVALQILLIAFQLPLAKLAGGLAARPAPQTSAVRLDGFDSGFSGGVSGLPGLETIVVPGHWIDSFTPDQLRAVLLRRSSVLASGARLRGLAAAMIWNTSGFALCAQLPGAGVERLWEFVTTLVAFTLWSFLGLLLLPSISRPAVIVADRQALNRGANAAALRDAILEIDHWQEDEPQRGRWIERVFHPIPAVENRLRALESGATASGAWHAARMALFLSWANFGMLSRAVHCNAGRPELWVLFPGD